MRHTGPGSSIATSSPRTCCSPGSRRAPRTRVPRRLRHRPGDRRRPGSPPPAWPWAPPPTWHPNGSRAVPSTTASTSTRSAASCTRCSRGNPPFAGAEAYPALALRSTSTPHLRAPSARARPTSRRALDLVVATSMAKDPEARYPERGRAGGRRRGCARHDGRPGADRTRPSRATSTRPSAPRRSSIARPPAALPHPVQAPPQVTPPPPRTVPRPERSRRRWPCLRGRER